MRHAFFLPLLLAALTGAAPTGAAPRVPRDDAEVLERIEQPTAAYAAELRELRRELAAHPDDAPRAFAFVRRALRATRTSGDPRPLGQAEAVLAPFVAVPEPPPEALLLRATLRQGRHDFAGARADLDRAIALAPRRADARLGRGLMVLVEGRPDPARQDCAAVLALGARLEATTCLALVAGLTGRAEEGRRWLDRELAASDPADAEARRFALSALAELALAAGDAAGAERSLRTALALPDPEIALRAAYADLLLATGRAAEVTAVLEEAAPGDDPLRADALLLRRFLASRALAEPGVDELAARLEARFAMLRARGESFHAREEARFRLARGARAEALELARSNFAVQREVADALVLLEAARASGDPAVAEPVTRWMRETGIADARLAALEAQR